ncbi:VOC family protein [uncultured Legionella sp.]|uniref:VOC family protein n=1 Tax=uncultured Legionella sp. TaxID=210934 RepID=UPI00261977DA|nr:VOC family protein [uncultured Legionella sp.]
MDKPGEFCWRELATPNLNQAKEFYHKVFGWEFRDVKMETTVHTIASSREMDVAGMWQIPTDLVGKVRPHWMSYIYVVNLEESLTLALKHGAKVVRDIIEITDRGKYAVITDPTGAYIALWETTGDHV